MKAGQKELAIRNYEKSLQLNPKNQNAIEMLKKLNAMKSLHT
jgi:predicted TPR repeat methyltransferase